MNEENYDFIIIGAGICGLSLAGLLIRDGYKVLILEKLKNLGGRAKVVEKNGFTLDYGIHTVRFGKKSSLAKTLNKIRNINIPPIKYVELGTSYFYLESERDSHWEIMPTGLSGITKGKYFSISNIKKVMFKLMVARGKKYLNVSVKEWEEKQDFNIEGKTYLKLITGSMQVCPFLERASVGELMRNLKEVVKKRISVTYPIGGWKLIFEQLISCINKERGKILTDCEVKEILIENNEAKLVKTEKGDFKAKMIVIAVPVQNIFSFLDENKINHDFVELCKNLRPTAGLSLDICLQKKISDETGLFYFDNPIAFGFFTSNIDKASAPDGKQLFTICSPCNIEDLENDSFRKNLLNTIKEKLFKGFPEMEENIEFERPLFTIFDGVEVNTEQYKEKRPGFKVPGCKNLYLVGDSLASSGAGGDIGHNSVWDCYHLIKRDLKR
ncbi:MAG: phytoene desaturase family protein [Promethearchaeota archaeon]